MGQFEHISLHRAESAWGCLGLYWSELVHRWYITGLVSRRT